MKNLSDFAWLCILLIFLAIAGACYGIFGKSTEPRSDQLAQQIESINNLNYLNADAKERLLSEIIKKYNPTNTNLKQAESTK
jgi:uncharacterized protein YpmB